MSSSAPTPARRPFIDLYCEQNGIDPSDFDQRVLRQILYPHARLLAPLLRYAWPDYFSADLDLVRSAGLLRRTRDLSLETDAFAHHPSNVGVLRHLFRLRASSTRLARLIRATLHSDPVSAPLSSAANQADDPRPPVRT